MHVQMRAMRAPHQGARSKARQALRAPKWPKHPRKITQAGEQSSTQVLECTTYGGNPPACLPACLFAEWLAFPPCLLAGFLAGMRETRPCWHVACRRVLACLDACMIAYPRFASLPACLPANPVASLRARLPTYQAAACLPVCRCLPMSVHCTPTETYACAVTDVTASAYWAPALPVLVPESSTQTRLRLQVSLHL